MSEDPEKVKRNVMSSFWTKYNYITFRIKNWDMLILYLYNTLF